MYIPMEYTRTASSLLAIAVITLGSHFQCINATINDDHDVGGRKVPDGLDFDIGLGKDWTEDVLDRLAIYPSKTCSDQYEVKTKKIIRTEDSLQNNAEFVDAVISETFQNCFDACCSHDQECDTTVYIQGDRDSDENCFLFRCWFDDEQRCFFSSHEGYISSMIGGFANPRFSAYLQSNKQAADDTRTMYPEDDYNDGNEKQERPISPKKATTLPPVTMKLQSTTPSSDVKTYGKTTSTLKKPVGEQVCMTTQYKCPISRECIIKRLVCDNIPDCLDGSDEQGCNKDDKDAKLGSSLSKPKFGQTIDDMEYEDDRIPESIDESASYLGEEDKESDVKVFKDKSQRGPVQLHLPKKDQTLLQSSSRVKVLAGQSDENDAESSSDVQEFDGQQDIQHLRNLADKQKNQDDLLSMRDRVKEMPMRELEGTDDTNRDDEDDDDDGDNEDNDLPRSRCPSGRCRPLNEVLDDGQRGLATKDWHLDKIMSDDSREYDTDSKKKDTKLRMKPLLAYQDYGEDEGDYQDEDIQYNYPRSQQRVLNHVLSVVTQPPPKSQVRDTKPHRTGGLARHGSVISQYVDDDFPEQRYTDNDLLEKENTGHTYHRTQTKGNPHPAQHNDLKSSSQGSQDNGRHSTGITYNQRQKSLPVKTNFRNPTYDGVNTKQHSVEKVTTDQPMQWLNHKDPPIRIQPDPGSDGLESPVPDNGFKPAVEVADSDYFPNWHGGISLFYDDSYNIGDDWNQMREDTWQNGQMTKDMQRHNDVSKGWYPQRYDMEDDDEYGYYQPRQRNRGNDRFLNNRGRNHYPDHGRPRMDKPAKHKDRNRDRDDMEVDSSRHYQKQHEDSMAAESPDPHNDPEIPSHSLVTMAPPAPVQLQDGVVVDTNPKDSTLPPKPPPPTNKVEPNPKDLKGHGQSDRTNKEHGKESSVSRVEAGQVEIPTGALFPLIVGLLLTMFLIMMVGCRLRYMNRRLRYGRMKTNAHDADYLINGMYL